VQRIGRKPILNNNKKEIYLRPGCAENSKYNNIGSQDTTLFYKKAMYPRPGCAENSIEMDQRIVPCPPAPRVGYRQFFDRNLWEWVMFKV